ERPGYDARTDFRTFILARGQAFEAGVMRLLAERTKVRRIAEAGEDARRSECAKATIEAMREGVPVIAQGVLHDENLGVFGMPDLLVRADVLTEWFPDSLEPGAIDQGAPRLGTAWHYRVVDIKFTNLDLNAKGFVGNDGSDRRRRAQLLVYNRALGEMQGWEPWQAYLLGRSWAQRDERGDSSFDRLAPADMTDPKLATLVDDAVAWVRWVRSEGASWEVLPKPTVPELHPNMSNTQDSPWHRAKREIAEKTGELTQLWRVTPNNRPSALDAGVSRIDDPRCTSALFGLADSYAAKLRQIIETNRPAQPKLVRPDRVSTDGDTWREPRPLEFYVDFETVSDLDDDFSLMPRKGGQQLIFMIGCGHIEDGKWKFSVFTANRLVEPDEASIIDTWIGHMDGVRARLWPDGNPLVFHWSHAETSTLNTAYNSARKRHQRDWPDLNWYDFLTKVMREEPVTVKGALAFGLKAVARAMHGNHLIETEWDNGPGDGLAAMVGAWRCDAAARESGGSMLDVPLMKSIEDYNEVDCKVMQEIVAYLRQNH
ncbi:MAG: hypothetical protein ACHQ50_02770, partial [Fimbriimonadales bacterium]